MGKTRTCKSCRNKYDVSFFDTTTGTKCKACVLYGKRLNAKFFEMVTSETTGLRELQSYLSVWYPAS